jgi:hypothetical protein
MENEFMSLTEAVDPAKNSSPDNLNRQMNLYALAAAAAGVSVLVLTQPAEGEVIVTKQTLRIALGTGIVDVDINHDGVADFAFTQYSTGATQSIFWNGTAPGAGAVKRPASNYYAFGFMRAAKIGPSANFVSGGVIEAVHGSGAQRKSYGNFPGTAKNRYLGVRFLIHGETHYGWVRLSVDTRSPKISATITAYAYETVPNKPILAGTAALGFETIAPDHTESVGRPSLGMLALGADGMSRWRPKETEPSQ